MALAEVVVASVVAVVAAAAAMAVVEVVTLEVVVMVVTVTAVVATVVRVVDMVAVKVAMEEAAAVSDQVPSESFNTNDLVKGYNNSGGYDAGQQSQGGGGSGRW